MYGTNKAKYQPTKTQLTLSELRTMCDLLKEENRKLKADLQRAQKDRAWALEKLQKAQITNRQLGMTITFLSEKGESDG